MDIPLCVDLDGTLLRTDTLHEGVLLLLKRQPFSLLKIPMWLMRGKANLKREITKRIDYDVTTLPINREFFDYLQGERNKGRKIVLVTAADESLGKAIAEDLGIFDEVLSSDGAINLAGKQKAAVLTERFGAKGFDYAGNAAVDVPIWTAARRAVVVNASARTLREAGKVATIDRIFADRQNRFALWWRALRPHQWSKNLLLFIPLFGAHKWTDPEKLRSVLFAFVGFSLCASSVYLLNDLLDLTSDRRHARKVLRPFASGQLPISWGILASPLLLIAAFVVVSQLPVRFTAVFILYYVVTCLYSLRLKQIELVDVFILASLYGLRVIAGGFAAEVAVSDWLMVFCLFLFLSLAFVKRFTEMKTGQRENRSQLWGRGYQLSDADAVSKMGITSGYIAVVILALYVTNPLVTELYHRPLHLLLACPILLYWMSRVWLLAQRDQLHEDPIVFAFTDKQSWLVVMGLAVVVLISGPK